MFLVAYNSPSNLSDLAATEQLVMALAAGVGQVISEHDVLIGLMAEPLSRQPRFRRQVLSRQVVDLSRASTTYVFGCMLVDALSAADIGVSLFSSYRPAQGYGVDYHPDAVFSREPPAVCKIVVPGSEFGLFEPALEIVRLAVAARVPIHLQSRGLAPPWSAMTGDVGLLKAVNWAQSLGLPTSLMAAAQEKGVAIATIDLLANLVEPTAPHQIRPDVLGQRAQ